MGAKVAAAAGGRCRRHPEVTNQGAMRSATSEQGDYDFEVEGLLGVRWYVVWQKNDELVQRRVLLDGAPFFRWFICIIDLGRNRAKGQNITAI